MKNCICFLIYVIFIDEAQHSGSQQEFRANSLPRGPQMEICLPFSAIRDVPLPSYHIFKFT